MKDNIIEAYKNFQIADFDHDMIGMCKAFVNFLKILKNEINDELPPLEPLEKFYKLDPHQPRMTLRENYRRALGYAMKSQDESDIKVNLLNLYTVVIAGTYIYHMPTEEIIKASLDDKEFTREDSKNMLLEDNMSPNWIKEPSNTDFSSLIL